MASTTLLRLPPPTSAAPSAAARRPRVTTSDVTLVGNDLQGVPAAIGVATATYAVILENFGWAMGYNVSALPLAAAGLFDPLVAAVAMGLSSLLVVGNSLRLTRVGRDGRRRCAHHASPAGRSPWWPPSPCPSSCSPAPPWAPSSCRRPRARACCRRCPTSWRCPWRRAVRPRCTCRPGSPGPNELHLDPALGPDVGHAS